MSPNRRSDSASARGQTTLDFLVGVTLFVVVVAAVVAFLPRLAAPYQHQERPAVSERAADALAADVLAGREGPGVLNATCTRAFFAQTAEPGCPFDPAADLTGQLGIGSWYSVNVTLGRNVSGREGTDVLCANGGDIGRCGSDRLALGPPVPEGGRATATARRTVYVDGVDALLEVTVW